MFLRRSFWSPTRRIALGLAPLFVLALSSSAWSQPTATIEYGEVLAGAGYSFEVPIVLTFDGSDASSGFSLSACIDPTVVTPTGFTPTNIGGHTPGFLSFDTFPEGWTCGVLWDLGHPVIGAGTYELGQLLGDAPTIPTMPSTAIELCLLGNPPVESVVAIGTMFITPTIVPGSITVVPALRRGDTNDDGVLNIADAITLWAMFSPTTTAPPITCDDAADANDDGQIDVADVVTILAYLFQDGSIPAPLEGCGPDETPDALDCAAAGAC